MNDLVRNLISKSFFMFYLPFIWTANGQCFYRKWIVSLTRWKKKWIEQNRNLHRFWIKLIIELFVHRLIGKERNKTVREKSNEKYAASQWKIWCVAVKAVKLSHLNIKNVSSRILCSINSYLFLIFYKIWIFN